MRKKLIIAIVVIVCAVSAAVGILIATLRVKSNVSISLSGYSEENPPEIVIGEFPYGEYRVSVTRNSKIAEETALTEEMISDAEKLKFYREGEQTVTVSYAGATCEFKVIVRRKDLSGLSFEDRTVTYSGETVVMEVAGKLPSDVSVRYPGGNKFVNAGEYDVTAVVYGDLYVTQTFTARLTIEKAEIDMSGVSFESREYPYDGTERRLSVSGDLPQGVKVSYTIGEAAGNSAKDAGVYEVKAHFACEDSNYLPIDDMTATLAIRQAEYDLSGITLQDKTERFNGRRYFLALNDEGLLPNGVTVTYTIRKIKKGNGESEEGEILSGNGAISAGVYEVEATFSRADVKNYAEIPSMKATLTIEQAEYDLSGVFLYSDSVLYDGEEHTLSLKGETPQTEADLPAGVSVTYTVKKVKNADGSDAEEEEREGNGATEAGTYEITAHFSHSNENYRAIESVSATLVIGATEEQNA